ncbi:hypothetical protein OC861_004118 [Tilletia horrida]|nr:hypothetical protein OC861_004118 [Tilletia horrida]
MHQESFFRQVSALERLMGNVEETGKISAAKSGRVACTFHLDLAEGTAVLRLKALRDELTPQYAVLVRPVSINLSEVAQYVQVPMDEYKAQMASLGLGEIWIKL